MSNRYILLVTSLFLALLPAPALADPSGGALIDASGAPTFAAAPMRHVAAGAAHTCVVLDDESLRCFGSGADGRLGLGDTSARGDGPGEMGEALPAVDLGPGAKVVQVAAGAAHTCAVLDDGSLKCWGSGVDGRLGLGDTSARGDGPGEMGAALPAVDLGVDAVVEQVVTGNAHTCALLRGGAVKCFGRGADGQLGLGDSSARGDGPGEMGDTLPALALGRAAVGLAAGDAHTCALLDDATVVCWGDNQFGQLGRGDTTTVDDAAQATPIDLDGAGALAVAAGGGHTCVITDAARLACVGAGSDGQLGTGDTEDRGDEPGETGANLVVVDVGAGRGVRAAAAGGSHTCLVTSDGRLRCVGSGAQGRLGYGNTQRIGDEPGELGEALEAVDLGTGRTVRAVAAGDAHTCAILDDGSLKCFGSGAGGRRGSGDTTNAGHAPATMGDALIAVSLGAGRTARVTSEPGAATGLAATAGDGSASLTWRAPVDDGGSAIIDYVVEWREIGGAWAVLDDGVSAGATATITGLSNGVEHEFRVRARNSVALGAASTTSAAFRPVAPPPPTSTTVPSGGSSGGSSSGSRTTTTTSSTPTTVASPADPIARGIVERRVGPRRVTLPAFEVDSVALTPAQRVALRRVATSLRAGSAVRCLVQTSDPRLVSARSMQRAAATCRALRALAPGIDARVRVVTLRPDEARAAFRVVLEVRGVGIRGPA